MALILMGVGLFVALLLAEFGAATFLTRHGLNRRLVEPDTGAPKARTELRTR